MLICVGKLTIIGSDNGLSPDQRQTIIWTNAGILLSTHGNKLQWNLNRNWNIFIQENVFENIVWKMVTIVSPPQCVKADTWSAMDPLKQGTMTAVSILFSISSKV